MPVRTAPRLDMVLYLIVCKLHVLLCALACVPVASRTRGRVHVRTKQPKTSQSGPNLTSRGGIAIYYRMPSFDLICPICLPGAVCCTCNVPRGLYYLSYLDANLGHLHTCAVRHMPMYLLGRGIQAEISAANGCWQRRQVLPESVQNPCLLPTPPPPPPHAAAIRKCSPGQEQAFDPDRRGKRRNPLVC
ncbi:hypothetical protein GGR52DRAFT_426236 [Hypoxylon sp. FL1284]|nr:hypothetical protein GGR52DRAFT_426236 [Hypoxylon sp. FL1284]